MRELGERIRRARCCARISQQGLADKVGVQRSAVAQWERRGGSHPSMSHLLAIAIATDVSLEWLGTGRGQVKPEKDEWIPAVALEDFVQDDLELECLNALRNIPLQTRRHLVSLISLVAQNFACGQRSG